MIESSDSHKTNNRERHLGTVIWFDNQRGYGFIRPTDPKTNDGKEIFCHFHGIIKNGFKELEKDDCVEFSIGTNHKGSIAVDILRKDKK